MCVIIDDIDGDVRMPVRNDLLLDTLSHFGLLFHGSFCLASQEVGSFQVHLFLVPETLIHELILAHSIFQSRIRLV